MFRREPEPSARWLLAVAAVAGASAAAYGVVRLFRAQRRRREGPAAGSLEMLETDVVEALRRDPVTGRCAIDVAAIAPGIVELTGTVPTHEASQRAARLLHAVGGVLTVINRLDVGAVGGPAPASAAARSAGPAGGHWTGIGTGMGRRRQSPETDPAQRDDSAKLRERAIDAEQDVADITAGGAPSGI